MGDDGWYVSEVTVAASTGDAVSGVVSFDLALDGGGWAPYGGPVTLSDGEHTLELRASDAAGNVAAESLTVRVDTQPPDLNLAVGGSFCPGCGETMGVALDVHDSGSGVAGWSLTADGIGISNGTAPASESLSWDASGLGAGTHTLTLSASDVAGNSTDTSVSVQLVAPRQCLQRPPRHGPEPWAPALALRPPPPPDRP